MLVKFSRRRDFGGRSDKPYGLGYEGLECVFKFWECKTLNAPYTCSWKEQPLAAILIVSAKKS